MDLHHSINSLLAKTGSGRHITSSPYDTAWVARLGEFGEPLGNDALEWLRAHQLTDGTWGSPEVHYHHDRLVCTLAAMTALGRRRDSKDESRLRRAQLALDMESDGLLADPAGETVGFEMIVPTLMAEAEELGLVPPHVQSRLGHLARHRAAKLAALPTGVITRYVTVAFSAEMVGTDGLALLDVDNLQEENGSVAYSPSATAFYALKVRPRDRAALAYLQEYMIDGAVPYVVPIDVFECAWPLWNLWLAGVPDREIMELGKPHLDLLEKAWIPGRGIASVSNLAFTDGDATGMTYDVLSAYGREVDLEGVLSYEGDDHFRCYPLEANPSVSTNIHILGALRRAGFDGKYGAVRRILGFLHRTQTMQMFWFDKWHASPYYPTSHAIIHGAGLDDVLLWDAVYWILATQNSDGSWGYYMSTAEETAYCLQALAIWERYGGRISGEVLARGADWLMAHLDEPYPPLWIGKALYCPELVVRSAILSALMLVSQV